MGPVAALGEPIEVGVVLGLEFGGELEAFVEFIRGEFPGFRNVDEKVEWAEQFTRADLLGDFAGLGFLSVSEDGQEEDGQPTGNQAHGNLGWVSQVGTS